MPRLDRRQIAGWLAAGAMAPAWAREGVEVGELPAFLKSVPAEPVERMAAEQVAQMLGEAAAKQALLPPEHPQVLRLRTIAARLLAFGEVWNPRASQWQWGIHLIKSKRVDSFCWPGGKIVVFQGLLARLQLTDDELAFPLGHEIAHALREHARARIARRQSLQAGSTVMSAALGASGPNADMVDLGLQLMAQQFDRQLEAEADLVGLELAARAGYDPAASLTLVEKLEGVHLGARTNGSARHLPSGTSRRDLTAALPQVAGLYAKAAKPEQRFDPARED